MMCKGSWNKWNKLLLTLPKIVYKVIVGVEGVLYYDQLPKN